jgi:hypothetical protein
MLLSFTRRQIVDGLQSANLVHMSGIRISFLGFGIVTSRIAARGGGLQ